MNKKIRVILKKIFGNRVRDWYALYKNYKEHRIFVDETTTFDKIKNRELIEFYATFIGRGDLCFDVGANVGKRTGPLLKCGAKVVAVEPQDECVAVLNKKFGKRVQVVKKGVGSEVGVKKFFISNASTISSFSEDWINTVKKDRFKGYEWNKEVSMEMTTLDQLIETYGVPDFIKIDVEGYETEVLKGLSTPVRMICFEYTNPNLTDKAVSCIKLIEKNNKRVLCNFSEGESNVFTLERWMSVPDMCGFLRTPEFQKSDFGDIYIKLMDN